MFCTHVISFDNCLSSILQVLVGQKTQRPVNSVSTMATSVETCLAFRLRRLRRLCPKTKESFEPFDVTCLSSYWRGLGWLASFCKLCILCIIFVILQVIMYPQKSHSKVYYANTELEQLYDDIVARDRLFLEKSKFVLFFEQHRFCLQYQPVRAEKKVGFHGLLSGKRRECFGNIPNM